MAVRFAFLGTSAAVPTAERDTTSLVFTSPGGGFLVDCGGSPVQKLRRLGVDPLGLTHVVITHLHPDHAYGLPALLQNLRMLGRSGHLAIVTHPEHVEALATLMTLFRVWKRSDTFEVALSAVPAEEAALAFETDAFRVRTSPVVHGDMPNFAVRVESRGRAAVYSSDTTPCEAVVRLARGADVLIHEATVPARDRDRSLTHTSAEEAGEIAARAGVRRLILAHIDAGYHRELDALAAEAGKRFGGEVEIARELAWYEL
jgi:ribonuclease Z